MAADDIGESPLPSLNQLRKQQQTQQQQQQPNGDGLSPEEAKVVEMSVQGGVVYSEVGLKRTLRELEEAKEESERRKRQTEVEQADLKATREQLLSKKRTAKAQNAQRAAARRTLQDVRADVQQQQQAQAAAAAAVAAAAAALDDTGMGGTKAPPKRQRLPLPLFDVETLGLTGGWEEVGGNFMLRPPEGTAARGVIHFLGGAFVGAAPHLTYSYLLSGLAEVGFVVVATPYQLGFDYLQVCDAILERFELAALPLAEEYGALPVIGIGHSLGALLQLLITCLFPDTPRAANALVSFNNKPVKQAVPAFDEVVLPLVTQLLAEGSPSQQAAEAIWEARTSAMDLVESFVKSPLAPAAAETELLPLAKQALELVEQLPPLFQQVADGAREFTPTPDEVEEVVRRMYRARRTLVVRFDNDSIDESEEVREVIQAGKTLLRMRRPMVDMDLRYEVLTGNHITPLTQDIFTPPQPLAGPLPDACPIRQRARQDFLRTVNDLGQVLVEWLEEGLSMTSAYNPQ